MCACLVKLLETHPTKQRDAPPDTIGPPVIRALHAFRCAAAVCLRQVVGTSIFLSACIAGCPGVLPGDLASSWVLWDLLFWTPFLLGSCLFIFSSALSLRDALAAGRLTGACGGSRSSVWRQLHIAQCIFNVVGSVGFWLCSFFGFFAYPMQKYQRWGMAFSCLWGSCCFAVAAIIQLVVACRARLRSGVVFD